MKKEGSESKWLVIALAGLGVVMVGLIIGLVVARINNDNLVVFDEDEGAVDCSKVEELEDTTQAVNCLGYDYENGKEDEVVWRYQKMIEKSYENGDEDAFYELLTGLAWLRATHGQCDEAFAILRDDRIEQLSLFAKLSSYNEGMSIAEECGNEELEYEYEKKAREIEESGELESFSDIDAWEGEEDYVEEESDE